MLALSTRWSGESSNMNTRHEGSSTAGLPSCAFKGRHYTHFGRGGEAKTNAPRHSNVSKSILKAHEEQAYKTTPIILITESFLI